MPIIHKRDLRKNVILGIWEVDETEEMLLLAYPPDKNETVLLNSFSHPFRRSQFLATRLLLHTLIPGLKIEYDENGKPWTNSNQFHLSISHSGKYIALLIDEAPCGIDIETIRAKIEKIAPKYLSEVELVTALVEPAVERLHVYWCVKEAIYKVYGKKNVSLKTDIFVQKVNNPQEGLVTATLKHDDSLVERKIHYEKFKDCMLAWTE